MTSELETLQDRISTATGQDRALDLVIATTIDSVSCDPATNPAPNYTSSVDTCVKLIGSILPDWHWHVGYGAGGVLPYASLSRLTPKDGSAEHFVEATSSTVPLSLLLAAVRALIKVEQGKRK